MTLVKEDMYAFDLMLSDHQEIVRDSEDCRGKHRLPQHSAEQHNALQRSAAQHSTAACYTPKICIAASGVGSM